MKRSFLLLVSVLLIASTVIFGCAPQQAPATPTPTPAVAKELKFGILGPMKFALGQQTWNAAVISADMINESGGIKVGKDTYTVKVIQYDTNEFISLDDAVSAAERAVTVDKCNFVVGGIRTEAVLAMQEVMMDHKVIYFDSGSGVPAPVEKVKKDYTRYKYYFKPSASADIGTAAYSFADADAVARKVKEDLGIDKVKVAVAFDKVAFGDIWQGLAEKVLPAMGMEIVGMWRPSANANDLFSEASAMAAKEPHIIFVNMSAQGGAALVNAYAKLKIPAIMAGSVTETQRLGFWKESGGAVNYVTGYDTIGRVKMSSKTIPFWDRYVAKFNEKPGYSSPFAEGAISAIKAALESTGSLDNDALVTALEKTDVEVTNGRLKFYGENDKLPFHYGMVGPGLRTMVSYQWLDGKMQVYFPDGKPVSDVLLKLGLAPGYDKVRYEGTVDLTLPPWMVDYWKKK
jgi:branched-chain amino acid transport system substrate-binding protein